MPKILENLREKIVEEGKRILKNGRYADFNIREIAKVCDIGTGTLYNYFQNKEELALEIFKQDWDKTLTIIDSLIAKDGSIKVKLFEIFCSLEEFIHSYMAIFMELASEKGKGNASPHEYYKEVFVRMKVFIDSEKTNGSIRSEVDSDKLSYFIITNMISCIKNQYMSFDELYECMKL